MNKQLIFIIPIHVFALVGSLAMILNYLVYLPQKAAINNKLAYGGSFSQASYTIGFILCILLIVIGLAFTIYVSVVSKKSLIKERKTTMTKNLSTGY